MTPESIIGAMVDATVSKTAQLLVRVQHDAPASSPIGRGKALKTPKGSGSTPL